MNGGAAYFHSACKNRFHEQNVHTYRCRRRMAAVQDGYWQCGLHIVLWQAEEFSLSIRQRDELCMLFLQRRKHALCNSSSEEHWRRLRWTQAIPRERAISNATASERLLKRRTTRAERNPESIAFKISWKFVPRPDAKQAIFIETSSLMAQRYRKKCNEKLKENQWKRNKKQQKTDVFIFWTLLQNTFRSPILRM